MIDQEIPMVRPAFAGYPGRFLQKRTAVYSDNYCRGLLTVTSGSWPRRL
jgi:hypothetical protein